MKSLFLCLLSLYYCNALNVTSSCDNLIPLWEWQCPKDCHEYRSMGQECVWKCLNFRSPKCPRRSPPPPLTAPPPSPSHPLTLPPAIPLNDQKLELTQMWKKIKRDVHFDRPSNDVGKTRACAELVEYTIEWWIELLTQGPKHFGLYYKANQAVIYFCTPHDLKILENLIPEMERMIAEVQARIDKDDFFADDTTAATPSTSAKVETTTWCDGGCVWDHMKVKAAQLGCSVYEYKYDGIRCKCFKDRKHLGFKHRMRPGEKYLADKKNFWGKTTRVETTYQTPNPCYDITCNNSKCHDHPHQYALPCKGRNCGNTNCKRVPCVYNGDDLGLGK